MKNKFLFVISAILFMFISCSGIKKVNLKNIKAEDFDGNYRLNVLIIDCDYVVSIAGNVVFNGDRVLLSIKLDDGVDENEMSFEEFRQHFLMNFAADYILDPKTVKSVIKAGAVITGDIAMYQSEQGLTCKYDAELDDSKISVDFSMLKI